MRSALWPFIIYFRQHWTRVLFVYREIMKGSLNTAIVKVTDHTSRMLHKTTDQNDLWAQDVYFMPEKLVLLSLDKNKPDVENYCDFRVYHMTEWDNYAKQTKKIQFSGCFNFVLHIIPTYILFLLNAYRFMICVKTNVLNKCQDISVDNISTILFFIKKSLFVLYTRCFKRRFCIV